MKNFFVIIFTFLVAFSCKNNESDTSNKKEKEIYSEITGPGYELNKPSIKARAVLILFGGYPEVAEDIKREFKILERAKRNNIAVLFSNYNQKLWFEENEKEQLAIQLQRAVLDNNLPTDNIYLGGFSSGGNIALLIGDYLQVNNCCQIYPKGVFIVDSPVDLAELYLSAEKNVSRNFSKVSVQESTWLIETLGKRFGDPNTDISKYQKYSAFTLKSKNIDNIKNLKNTEIRLYTEPDTLWWEKNRRADYEQMNAYHIKRLSETLKKMKFKSVEYIPTKNKGYRANGERHPHSWSIVDTKELICWMLNK